METPYQDLHLQLEDIETLREIDILLVVFIGIKLLLHQLFYKKSAMH